MLPAPLRSRRLAWHYWISILRLVAAGIALPITILAGSKFKISPLVGWGFVVPMDIILVTVDLKYDAGFPASFLGQLLCSLSGAALFLTYLIQIAPEAESFPVFLLFLFPYLCATLYSIGISISLILALRAACLKDPRFVLLHVDVSWLVNGKDLVMGRVDTLTKANFFGARRPASLSPLVFPTRSQSAQRLRRVGAYFVQVVFRRISPVETRPYAFIRNIFGLLAVLAIIIRAATLLARAQGEVFKTNTYTENCNADWSSLWKDEVTILVRDPSNRYKMTMPLNSDAYRLRIQMSHSRGALADCLPSSRYHLESGRGLMDRPTDWFAAYLCDNAEAPTQKINLQDTMFNLTLTSLNGSALSTSAYPQIWIVPALGHDSDIMQSPAPWLVPLWQPVPGVHTEAEFTMAKRKFITSSFFRDIVTGAKPSFETVPMFPIVTTRQTSLNNDSIATAILRPNPRFISTSSAAHKDIQGLMVDFLPMPITCEVVEDYRSSTALDALGSIGGLLAILQSLHLLLFGRPLFWGIAGTKLINPFGIVGSCGSRGFRRRLREHYYTTPGQVEEARPEDSLRITAFLRDFVVDFGPADYETNKRQAESPLEPRDDDPKLESIEMGSKTHLLPALELSPTPIRLETRHES